MLSWFDGPLLPHGSDTFRGKVYQIIFRHDTREGRLFDVVLIWAILFSIVVLVLDSFQELSPAIHTFLYYLEWFLTIVFTIELAFRLYSLRNPGAYLLSFWGIVDMISILPSYVHLFVPGSQFLMVIRILRIMRVFRILKLVQYIEAAETLLTAIKQSIRKITVFWGALLVLVFIMGTLMHVIEGGTNGFENVPKSIYWAIITITTVGYGDIVPHTIFGKLVASLMMVTGYAILAVPTGIVTVELGKVRKNAGFLCRFCLTGNSSDSNFCKNCGARLYKGKKKLEDLEEDADENPNEREQ